MKSEVVLYPRLDTERDVALVKVGDVYVVRIDQQEDGSYAEERAFLNPAEAITAYLDQLDAVMRRRLKRHMEERVREMKEYMDKKGMI